MPVKVNCPRVSHGHPMFIYKLNPCRLSELSKYMKASARHSTVSWGKENSLEKNLCPEQGLYTTFRDKQDGLMLLQQKVCPSVKQEDTDLKQLTLNPGS